MDGQKGTWDTNRPPEKALAQLETLRKDLTPAQLYWIYRWFGPECLAFWGKSSSALDVCTERLEVLTTLMKRRWFHPFMTSTEAGERALKVPEKSFFRLSSSTPGRIVVTQADKKGNVKHYELTVEDVKRYLHNLW